MIYLIQITGFLFDWAFVQGKAKKKQAKKHAHIDIYQLKSQRIEKVILISLDINYYALINISSQRKMTWKSIVVGAAICVPECVHTQTVFHSIAEYFTRNLWVFMLTKDSKNMHTDKDKAINSAFSCSTDEQTNQSGQPAGQPVNK